MNKIAICVTTFLRDKLLYKALESIVNAHIDDSIVLIADQGYRSDEKNTTYDYFKSQLNCEIYYLPFDCGLSYARNYLVNKASELKIPYCLISADSIAFEKHYDFENHIALLESNAAHAVVGFDLKGSKCKWEYNMSVDKQGIHFTESDDSIVLNEVKYIKVDICRNIFLAKTELIKNMWDNDFKVGEHELSFLELKNRNVQVLWTKDIEFKKMNSVGNAEYQTYRNRLNDYLKKLKAKLNIQKWVIVDSNKKEKHATRT